MVWLLGISVLAVFGLGFIVMNKIDNFLEQPYVFSDSKHTMGYGKPYVLVFGFSELTENLILQLKNHEIDYLQLVDENELDKTKYYSHLFAINHNDLNNLLVCAITNRMNEKIEKIAICNCADNQNIYEQNHIRYLSTENLDANVLFYNMFPSIDKGIHNDYTI